MIASPIVPGALYRVSGHPTFVCATNGAHAIAKVLEQQALAADRAANKSKAERAVQAHADRALSLQQQHDALRPGHA